MTWGKGNVQIQASPAIYVRERKSQAPARSSHPYYHITKGLFTAVTFPHYIMSEYQD